MRKKSRRKKNEERKRRFDVIKDLMSTFTMASVAVIAAVVLIPSSPKAEIVKSVALSKEIVYQVNVTDEDNALDLSGLYVVLENQLEYYETPINLGENSGYFDNLETNTQYRLSVYGNKGFGLERLDTVKLTTTEKIGGTILSVKQEQIDFSTLYMIDVSIFDPESKYTSINLYYGSSWEQDLEIQYSSIAVTSPIMDIEIDDIFTSNPIHFYLEGITVDGSELLDEIWVTPPYQLYSSVYMHYLNSEEIGFSVYNDMGVENITYVMNIYKHNLLIRTEKIVLDESSFEGSEFIIDELKPNTTYAFECIATYKNPQTLRQEDLIVYDGELTTLDVYTYSYTKEIIDNNLEVTILLNDPNNYFQEVFYDIYDTSTEQNMYLSSETYLLTGTNFDKSSSFIISLPDTSSYIITITIRSEVDYSIKQKIDIIIFE